MVVSSSSICLVLFSLFCICCQHHASALIASNSTSGHSVAAVGSGRDNVTNTTARLNDARPPLLWSKAKDSWPPAPMEGVSWSRLLKEKGSIGAGDHFSIHDARRSSSRANNYTYSNTTGGSAAAAPASNTSAAEQATPPHRRAKNGHAARGRNKPLCSYHRAASLLHGRVDCSGVVVVGVAGSALLVLLCTAAATVLLLLRCVHDRNLRGEIADGADDDLEYHNKDEGLALPNGPRPYSYRKLAAAARNLAERRIGCGGFGSVYRGYLADQDSHVAVKVFSPAAAGSSGDQGRREFDAEVRVMSQLRNRNVVRLVGWSDGDGGRNNKGRLLLAYELAPGGSLDKSLHGDPEKLLTWPERYRIVLGLGSAILYLHTECEQRVVHGDIKPANIMLDASRNAKLGDFGPARFVAHDDDADPRTTQVVAGTLGYIDPEFVGDRKRCAESDVYNFGVVLLEIASGQRPAKKGAAATLQDRVRELYDRDAVLDVADRRLEGAFDERQMERVLVTGLWCAHRDRTRRPSIAEATAVLRSKMSDLPVLPPVAAPLCALGQSFAVEGMGDVDDLSSDDNYKSTRSSASTVYLSPQGFDRATCAGVTHASCHSVIMASKVVA